MEKKYEFTEETINVCGRTLHRIKALRDFGHVKAGELGGFIEKEDNLSHEGNCWVSGNARVFVYARVLDNAQVYGDARVLDNAQVYGDARVLDNAQVSDNAWVFGDARVYGDARVLDNAQVSDNAWVFGNAWVTDSTNLYSDAFIESNNDYAVVKGFGSVNRMTTFYRTKDNHIKVVCGCFKGTLKEFRSKAKRTYPNHCFGKEYLMIADLMEKRFKNRFH